MVQRLFLLFVVFGLLTVGGCGDPPESTPEPTPLSEDSADERTSDAVASDPADPEFLERISGEWGVVYEDVEHGRVEGRAILLPEIDFAEVTFKDPTSGEDKVLQAEQIQISGRTLKLSFSAPQPSTEAGDTAVGQRVSVAQPTVKMSLGEGETSINVQSPPWADPTVVVSLTYEEKFDVLSGSWRQPVEALTGRSSTGSGRSGHFLFGTYTEGDAEVFGAETWTRPKARVQGAFAVNDQLSESPTGYLYPSLNEQRDKGNERMVFVYGKQLPRYRLANLEIEETDPGIDYEVFKVEEHYKDAPADTYWKDLAFEKIKKIQAGQPEEKIYAEDDNFVVVRAKLKPGVQPGRKRFWLNGSEAEWVLRFGDYTGTLGFARDLTLDLADQEPSREPIPIATELTQFLYRPEPIYLEVRVTEPLPIASLQLLLSRNGKIVKLGDSRAITAARSMDPNQREVYRSPPIFLAQANQPSDYPEDAWVLSLNPGDQLEFVVLGDQLNLTPLVASATTVHTPAEIGAVLSKDSGRKHMLWKEAVFRAGQCAGIDALMEYSDINTLSREEAERYTDYAVNQVWWWREAPVSLTTQVKVGEHAATLMIRQMLVDLLRYQIDQYEQPLSETALKGEIRRLSHLVKHHDHPLGLMEVDSPDGSGKEELLWSFYPLNLEEQYGFNADQAEQHLIKALKEGRRELVVAMKKALSRAESVGECELRDLLLLTGFGLDAVTEQTHASLVKLRTYEGALGALPPARRLLWVADRQAIARVDTVRHVAERLRQQEAYSQEDWDDLMTVLAVSTFPVVFMEGALAAGFVLLIDVTDFGYVAYRNLGDLSASALELEFARGISAIAGTERFREAEAQAPDQVLAYASMAFSGIAAGGSIRQFVKTLRITDASVERGTALVQNLQQDDGGGDTTARLVSDPEQTPLREAGEDVLARVDQLSEQERIDLFSAAVRANRIRQELGSELLDIPEFEVVEFTDLVESAVAEVKSAGVLDKPRWAQGLSDDAYVQLQRIRTMLVDPRHDHFYTLRRWAENSPERLAKLLVDEEGFLHLRLAKSSLEDVEKAVERVRRTVDSPGPAYRAQAVPGGPEGDGLITKVTLNDDSITIEVHLGTSADGGPQVAKFIRRRDQADREIFLDQHGMGELLPSDAEMVVFQAANTNRSFATDGPLSARRLPARRWITGLPHPLTDRGVPFGTHYNMMSIQGMGFTYADPRLRVIKLESIISANTVGEMHWLRHAYAADISDDELFRLTASYRYTENVAKQMGFRIGRVRVDAPSVPGPTTLRELVSGWFDPGGPMDEAGLKAAQEAFLKLYEVAGEATPRSGFNVYLELIPLA